MYNIRDSILHLDGLSVFFQKHITYIHIQKMYILNKFPTQICDTLFVIVFVIFFSLQCDCPSHILFVWSVSADTQSSCV